MRPNATRFTDEMLCDAGDDAPAVPSAVDALNARLRHLPLDCGEATARAILGTLDHELREALEHGGETNPPAFPSRPMPRMEPVDRILSAGDATTPLISIVEGPAPEVTVNFAPCDVITTGNPNVLRKLATRLNSVANSMALLQAHHHANTEAA